MAKRSRSKATSRKPEPAEISQGNWHIFAPCPECARFQVIRGEGVNTGLFRMDIQSHGRAFTLVLGRNQAEILASQLAGSVADGNKVLN